MGHVLKWGESVEVNKYILIFVYKEVKIYLHAERYPHSW